MNIYNAGKISIVAVLITTLVFGAWFYSGWPPSKIQEARADQQITTVETWASDLNGWTWTSISDNGGVSSTEGFDGADGNPAGAVFNDITNGKNKTNEGYFSKTFTWEALSIPAGATVTSVDGKFDYSHPIETHASVQSLGLMVFDSANTTNILDPAANLETAFDPGAPSASWFTRDTDAAKNVAASYQASNTTITVRVYMLTASGNNNGADSRNLMDNIVMTINYTPAAATVSCSTDITSTDFGALSSASINTSSSNASTTMSCSGTSSGCALYVKDAGNGTNPGLSTSSPAYLIGSANAAFAATTTLAAGTEGYGIQATTTSAGLTIAARYNWATSTNIVGGLALTNQTIASSSADITNAQVIVTHKAAIKDLTVAAKYEDTITYECTVN